MAELPLLEVSDIETSYGQSRVLFGISFAIAPGEMVSLMGRNGMGKTTTVRSIMGLTRATAGSIRFAGEDIRDLPAYRVAKLGIGLVPEGRQVFPNLTTRENLVATAANRTAASAPWTLDKVLALFPRLASRAGTMANLLSGGEQQMLAIGRALMNRPTLLLLDEPSLGLSPILVREIFTIIRRVNEEQGMSILLVEQNAKVALETADYGYVLEIGRVVMNDSCERLMHSKDIQEFYLGAKEAGARGERRWKKKKTWR